MKSITFWLTYNTISSPQPCCRKPEHFPKALPWIEGAPFLLITGTNGYYRCVEAHFEDLESVWDDRYVRKYGFWRPYVMDVIFRYLNCGDLHLKIPTAGTPVSCAQIGLKLQS